jgi:general secretion pathway protein H
MTARPTRAAARRTAGFTLVEMLAAITILALVMALALPAVRRPPDRLRLEAAARTVASALRLARATAVARNAEVVLAVDADRRVIESPAVPTTRIDADIAVAMTIAAPERRGRGAGAIRFFPDGTSSGGDITLTLGARRARIEANWLTGNARLDLSGDGAP